MNYPQGPNKTAEDYINEKLEKAAETGAKTPEQIQTKVKEDIQQVSAEQRAQVQEYVEGVGALQGTKVEELEDGIGGFYDGKDQKIAQSTMEVRGGVEQTLRRMKEVDKHENYHAENKHLESMTVAAESDDGTALVMGGETFNETEVIEGLTVLETGDEFVDGSYKDHKSKLSSAMHSADVSIAEVRTAVNDEKDLRLIDDRVELQMAA